jgi:hypothetical protein
MQKFSLLLVIAFIASASRGQELNCKVVINDQQVNGSDKTVFRDMERSLANFLNTRKWTSDTYKNHEKINCSIFLNIQPNNNPSIGNFSANAQITSSRPVFHSNYETILLNFADRDWEFEYIESQPLEYNDNGYISNLTSILAFYAYIIIGMDDDSFSELGGSPYFQKALNVVNNAQTSGRNGWQGLGGTRNRYALIDNINNPQMVDLRKNTYRYHRLALDTYDKTPEASREIILDVVKNVKKVWTINPTSIFVISFFDTKAVELANIFSEGNISVKRDSYDLLTSIDPKRTVYQKIISN